MESIDEHEPIKKFQWIQKLQVAIMADLLAARLIAYFPPFLCVRVDYFGSFNVKWLRKAGKRLCCLFTCTVNRAMHIEMVHTLENDSFIMALHRMISRRASCRLSTQITVSVETPQVDMSASENEDEHGAGCAPPAHRRHYFVCFLFGST